MIRLLAFVVTLLLTGQGAFAHEVRAAYLEIDQTSADSYDVIWRVPGLSDKLHLGLQVLLPANGNGAAGQPTRVLIGPAG